MEDEAIPRPEVRPATARRRAGGGPAAYGLAALAVVVAALAAAAGEPFFPASSLALFFLIAVLVSAVWFGLWPSLLASVASFLAYNFFFTAPYHTFYVHSRDDALALALFLIAAVVISELASRVRAQAEAQRALARHTGNLYEFGRRLATAVSREDVALAAAHHVAVTLRCRSVVLIPAGGSGSLDVAGRHPADLELTSAEREAAVEVWHRGEPDDRGAVVSTAPWRFFPLATDQGRLGLLGAAFDAGRLPTSEERRLLNALCDQAAVAVERVVALADLEESRLLSETERLRSALLSSISHDLRTPLVSIIGSASTLLHYDEFLDPTARRELAETIRREGERLNRFVQNLLDMTRLGSGALVPKRDWVDVRELVGRAMHQLRSELSYGRVRIDVPSSLPPIYVDQVLMEQVLVNVLDNAAKHAPGDSPIGVSARTAGGTVALAVADQGPGIPPADRDQVFDMFYRVRAADRDNAGTGLGLAICRGIVEAHGGRIMATAAADGTGTRIEIVLPIGPDAACVSRNEQRGRT